MTARKTSASASDLRLWLTPMLEVMETVNRLAASVNNSSMSHDKIPALVKNGNLAVETSAEQRRIRPKAQILIKSSGLVQFLVLVISKFLSWVGSEPSRTSRYDGDAKRQS